MKGLMLKDWLIIKRYARTTALICGVFAIVSLVSASNASFAGMITMIATMLAINAFSYDEQAKWSRYCVALPLPRKAIVGARYAVGLALWLGSFALTEALTMVSSIIHATDLVGNSMSSSLIAFAMLLVISTNLPLIYKFGIEKGRIFMLLSFLAPAVVIGVPILIAGDAASSFFLYGLPPIALLAYAASYFLSVRVVERQEY